ncbi:flagellar basal body rod protein FlgB [Spirochaeta africana]|uniref:Flagellar basal body rod protein FlgB n=1 Tax=Spirochaeta africana (strain ATCC 700263 / DSM 8902 / Z-7692) TaxID=889378 RepID=H9UKW3_SPIAZ|nr:flagellar basal body rod protein FlgB [Spirochaeta africana]AFG38156.1 flagellar basal-body rod protein FlgB [Spirochaeta africana DSM 8902]
MFGNSSFGRTTDILHRTMDVNMLRQSVIADNIANVDTPNFKRSEINFETSLRQALESEKYEPFPQRLTHDRHIPFHRPMDYRDVRPRRNLDFTTSTKNNGNNVDIEIESMNLLNSQLAYQMMTENLSSQFRQVNIVLR